MKNFLIFFLVIFFLEGCQKISINKPVEKDIVISKKEVPSFLILEDEKKNPIGRAVPVGNSLFISPDHLLKNNSSLYYKGKKIKILVRDFENDILVFILEDQFWERVKFSKNPPAVGKKVFWFADKQIKQTQILGIGESFSVDNWKTKNLLSIEGIAYFGDSGSLVFDESGLVYGMLIGSDKAEQKSYAIRSDVLLHFLEENIDSF